MDTLPTQQADNDIKPWEQDAQLVTTNIYRYGLPLLERLNAMEQLFEDFMTFQALAACSRLVVFLQSNYPIIER